MELKEQNNKYDTTQYIVKDGDFEVDVTEILGTEEETLVFLYEEGLNIAIFRIICCRGIYEYGGFIRRFDGKNEELDYEDELAVIASYIIEQHNKEKI
jgi:hypothetical protein